MPSVLQSHKITVGARSSPLSLKQTEEVLTALKIYTPEVEFALNLVETTGDRDQVRSLRDLEKSDFFTKELDDMVLKGECRIAIHSAKDLPDPLPKGLCLACLTKGVDPADSLVVKAFPFPQDGIFATSSIRREETIKRYFPLARCVDIRGKIEQRLEKLQTENLDGVVIAEAALIRLGLTHLPRMRLPGSVHPMQGRLAVIARENDIEIQTLFAPLNVDS